MPRIRTIKPKIVHDALLNECSYAARWLFVALISQADDYGRLPGSTGSIRGACLPRDDEPLAQVDEWLGELEERGLIQRYLIFTEEYVQLLGWADNQRLDNAGQERIPPPPDDPDPHVLNVRDALAYAETGPSAAARREPPRAAEDRGLEVGSRKWDVGSGTQEVGDGKTEKNIMSGVFDADTTQECEHLAGWIVKNGGKRPTISAKWLRDMERLRRLDGRSHEQVMAAIDWCQQDEFWRANVLSPSKLREKYEQLRLQAARSPAAHEAERQGRLASLALRLDAEDRAEEGGA